MCLNDDLLSIVEANETCNRYGIDTMSAGAVIAFAIECYERGIITREDTNGIELTWNNEQSLKAILEQIVNREGLGDILADGVKKAAERIGSEADKCAIHVGGQEPGFHDPCYYTSRGTGYVCDPTPGRHTAASIDFIDIGPINKFQKGFKLPKGWKRNESKKIEGQKLVAAFHQVLSSAGLCSFSTLFGPYPFIDLINNFTGCNITVDELITIGLRIQTLRQAFTLREELDIANNKLPGRVTGHPPDKRGPTKGISVDYEEFYRGYCREMGWNPENGYPLKETLKALNLEFVIKDLY